MAAVLDAIHAGVPVGAYFHWTLADTYEWGSYQPRFGLYAVDRDRGARWSSADAMGGDAARAYRRIADGLRVAGPHGVHVSSSARDHCTRTGHPSAAHASRAASYATSSAGLWP